MFYISLLTSRYLLHPGTELITRLHLFLQSKSVAHFLIKLLLGGGEGVGPFQDMELPHL